MFDLEGYSNYASITTSQNGNLLILFMRWEDKYYKAFAERSDSNTTFKNIREVVKVGGKWEFTTK